MATRKQKRLAGEQRRAEVDAKHAAEIAERKRIAAARAQRRAEREASQARQAAALKAFNNGLRPTIKEG
jgi:hypothetical protein